MKKRGPKPKDGEPRNITVAGLVSKSDLRALRAVMKAKGITTRSAAVAFAIRTYVKANGVEPQAVDPAQQPIGFLPQKG